MLICAIFPNLKLCNVQFRGKKSFNHDKTIRPDARMSLQSTHTFPPARGGLKRNNVTMPHLPKVYEFQSVTFEPNVTFRKVGFDSCTPSLLRCYALPFLGRKF